MNRFFFLSMVILIGGLLTGMVVSAQPPVVESQPAASAALPAPDIQPLSSYNNGRVTDHHYAIFGPEVCTAFGDPFSPINSPWAPGLYTYRFRISIPADYEQQSGTDIVRVELFDPDSINTSVNNVSILHTERWYNTELNAGNNPSQIETLTCNGGNGDQRNSCILRTGEVKYNCTSQEKNDPAIFCHDTEDVSLVNPYWFVKVDENRGPNCNNPGSYTPSMNTQTIYELYYYRELSDTTMLQTPLASYTGQTGDPGIDVDVNNHGTDIRWVSPGAFNQFGEVPVDCGSPNGGSNTSGNPTRCGGMNDTAVPNQYGTGTGFEIDLSEDAPSITVDSLTGERYLYLDVTTVDGSSKNGFDLWAGPPEASIYLPADANARNVYMADNPNVRNSYGVSINAMGVIPTNANDSAWINQPLIALPASYAGKQVSLSLFDTDSGTTGPVYFYFDTLFFDSEDPANSEFYTVYGKSEDPERCFDITPNCNDTWVGLPGNSPAFIVTVPISFAGGTLYARYRAGVQDTYVWISSIPSISDNLYHATLTEPLLPGQPFEYGIIYNLPHASYNYALALTHTHPSEALSQNINLPISHTISSFNPLQVLYERDDGTNESEPVQGSIIVDSIVSNALTADTSTVFTSTLSFTPAVTGFTPITDSASFTRTVRVPQVSFTKETYQITETASLSDIFVTITPPNPYTDTLIQYTTIGGNATPTTDFMHPTGVVTIPLGSSSARIQTPAVNDNLAELDETFVLQLSPLAGAAVSTITTATVTILDDDAPRASFSSDHITVTEGTSSVTMTITIDQPPLVTGTLHITTTDGTAVSGTDFTPTVSPTISIPAGVTTATLFIPLIDDQIVEPAEMFTVQLTGIDTVNVSPAELATITILDDDQELPPPTYMLYLSLIIN